MTGLQADTVGEHRLLLRSMLGEDLALTDAGAMERYCRDWHGM